MRSRGQAPSCTILTSLIDLSRILRADVHYCLCFTLPRERRLQAGYREMMLGEFENVQCSTVTTNKLIDVTFATVHVNLFPKHLSRSRRNVESGLKARKKIKDVAVQC